MAQKFQFDLVSPERRLASLSVEAVQIPATDGDLTAMAGHAPLITTLRPGVLKIEGADGPSETAYFVTGGFADVAGPSVTVLAEQAMPVSEVTAELLDGFIATARAANDKVSANASTSGSPAAASEAVAAARYLTDLEALRTRLLS